MKMTIKLMQCRFFSPPLILLVGCGLIAILALFPISAFAQEDAKNSNMSSEKPTEEELELDEAELVEMEPVDVWAKLRQQSGKKVLSSETITKAPSITGTVTDALRGQSNIQFDSSSRAGGQGGEIRPPRISIRGSRPYENNYSINGIGTSNILNPTGLSDADTTASPTEVPSGEAQAFFVDRHLLGEITVLSENISAEYGGFQGGVVDAKLRDARMDRLHAQVRYKHTRDNWAKMHYNPSWSSKDMEKAVVSGRYQPKFDRHEYSVLLDGPLSDSIGFVASYGEKRSYIEKETVWGGIKDEKRINKNFLGKLNLRETDNGFTGALSFMYTPYEETRFLYENKDSEYYKRQGGWLASLDVNKRWDSVGQLRNTMGYQISEVSTIAKGNTNYSWRKYSTSGKLSEHAAWGSDESATLQRSVRSNEGGYGDYVLKQRTLSWKSVMDFEQFTVGGTSHEVKAGVEFDYTRASAEREGSTSYSAAIFSGAPLPNLTEHDGILADEQYASMKSITPKFSNIVKQRTYAMFLEDTFRIGRFMLRPGLRYSYDNITKNHNYAPRLYAELDALNNEVLILHAGWNRYYDNNLLTYALRQGGGLSWYNRNASTGYAWQYLRTTDINKFTLGNLNTPYSDEITAGVEVNVSDTRFKILYTNREKRDQIRSKQAMINGTRTNQYTNAGKSDYWGLDFSIARDFDFGWAGMHTFEIAATRSMLKTNSTLANNAMDDTDTQTGKPINPNYVYYNGSRMAASDLPASNYNRPWVVTLNHTVNLFDDALRIFNSFRYEAGVDGLKREGFATDTVDPTSNLYVYRAKRQPDNFVYDMAAEWDVIKKDDHALTLNFEMTNVFNKKNHSDTNPRTSYGSSYDMGRQIYAGFTLTW